MTSATKKCSVVIAGGGQVGLALALGLKLCAAELSVLLVDPSVGILDKKNDPRSFAITNGVMNMLELLGVFQGHQDDIIPIISMELFGNAPGKGRLLSLAYDKDLYQENLDKHSPVAYMVSSGDLLQRLMDQCKAVGVEFAWKTRVKSFKQALNKNYVTLSDKRIVEADLLIGCDGSKSMIRRAINVPVVEKSYGQFSVVGNLHLEQGHENRAYEFFFKEGPLAILPLKGKSASFVWSLGDYDSKNFLDADKSAKADLIYKATMGRFGEINLVSEVFSFPLHMLRAKTFISDRVALVGDAAHVIHPIAGLGLNLGYKDVACLVEVIVEASRLGLDWGDAQILQKYDMWRRADTIQSAIGLDLINGVFVSPFASIRAAGELGLRLFEKFPFLKSAALREDYGIFGSIPRLLKGQLV